MCVCVFVHLLELWCCCWGLKRKEEVGRGRRRKQRQDKAKVIRELHHHHRRRRPLAGQFIISPVCACVCVYVMHIGCVVVDVVDDVAFVEEMHLEKANKKETLWTFFGHWTFHFIIHSPVYLALMLMDPV